MDTQRLARVSTIGLALLALLAAMWAGLIRMGWVFPVIQPLLPMMHGPLMVCGFLGVVIPLERAVALAANRKGFPWYYASPLFTALGSLILVIGIAGNAGPLCMVAGSLGLVAIFAVIIKQQPALFTWTMGLGALFWLIGNLFWLAGWPIYHVFLWWMGFLVLTVVGERLELSRMMRLSENSQILFVVAVWLFIAGILVSLLDLTPGTQIAGIGEITMALWLLRYDLARRTIRRPGMPRYIGLCLLTGYVWLAIGGMLSIWQGGVPAGPYYDAMLHSVFVGFIISMIFGHAPIILPSILHVPINYSRAIYIQLVLLHGSLILRIAGDVALGLEARQWGGMLNAIALLVFIGTTVGLVISTKSQQRRTAARAGAVL